MTSSKDRRLRLLELARSRKAAGSSTGTTESISASPLSVAPVEGPEPVVERKRKRLVKAHSTAASTEDESSGSHLIYRRRKVTEVGGSSSLRPEETEKTEKGASPPLPAQIAPTSPPTPLPSPTPLPAPLPASQPIMLPTQTSGGRPAHSSASPPPQHSAATIEGGGESSLQGSGPSTEGLNKVIKLTKQLIPNRELINWSGQEVDMHLARQMVLSLKFSTQHR